MVRTGLAGLLLLAAVWAGAQEAAPEASGPVLYGDGGGRLWKWDAGEKTWLTPEGLNLVLGGLGTDELWGWSLEGDQARFFTLELPKKKADAKETADSQSVKADPPSVPVFDPQRFPVPERADRAGDRVLLLYGTRDGHPRYEVWKAGELVASRAWDDGRSVYAQALGPESGWMVAGRLADGTPWLELSGTPVPAPEGWRGRLTVAAWVAEKSEEEIGSADQSSPGEPQAPPPPPVVHPWAAGWGARGAELPRPLIWGPDGWTQPVSADETPAGGTYPVLGKGGDQGTLLLAGWQADAGNGSLRPWFWDGEAAEVPGGTADGQPQAFSAGGKGGPVLVVAHQSAPWFTLEDGKTSVPAEGLDQGDRVVAVEASDAKEGPGAQ